MTTTGTESRTTRTTTTTATASRTTKTTAARIRPTTTATAARTTRTTTTTATASRTPTTPTTDQEAAHEEHDDLGRVADEHEAIPRACDARPVPRSLRRLR